MLIQTQVFTCYIVLRRLNRGVPDFAGCRIVVLGLHYLGPIPSFRFTSKVSKFMFEAALSFNILSL